jgi:UDP-2-acetamido-2,6-beta-L-arabino-hexul-4-ose reductase
MKRIGITGGNGFIGNHLMNTISLLKDEFALIPFERSFFDDEVQLAIWTGECDVIIHLAALNRHESDKVLHDTNIILVQKLINALEQSGNMPHVIFSSSLQEIRDNLYGISKKDGRILLKTWSERKNAKFTGLIIPNVFGPFGKPFYNSVVVTFCHQLCNGLMPQIDIDQSIKLIYVDELVTSIIETIRANISESELMIQHTSEYKVSEILNILTRYQMEYLHQGNFPSLNNKFELDLFNTFRSYIDIQTYFPKHFIQHSDQRGKFVEIAKLGEKGQVSFSTTHPGITRGNHFHTRKIERFAVIKGKAVISLRKYNTTKIFSFELIGESSAYVDIPVWYIHNIKNIGTDELITVFWINEFYNPLDADTYFEIV